VLLFKDHTKADIVNPASKITKVPPTIQEETLPPSAPTSGNGKTDTPSPDDKMKKVQSEIDKLTKQAETTSTSLQTITKA
jgi:hypothetical protein